MSFPCIVCRGESFPLREVETRDWGAYEIKKCSDCGLEFCSPMPSTQILDSFYADYEDIRAGDEVVSKNASLNIDRLHKLGITLNDRVLDYGSGKNAFVKMALLRGANWSSFDKYSVNTSRDVLIHDHYDAVVAWGVLEHVVDPIDFTKEMSSYLKRGGALIMTTVDVGSVIPFRYKPPEHVTYWSREAVDVLCKSAGFSLKEYQPYAMIQDKNIYMDIILRSVPDAYKKDVHYQSMPDYVEIPTNEVFIVCFKD